MMAAAAVNHLAGLVAETQWREIQCLSRYKPSVELGRPVRANLLDVVNRSRDQRWCGRSDSNRHIREDGGF
ncbi:hypothetical protein CHELA20_53774 [Hyphomicrobiales bacterium]|nr:hypothetical protein CHELA41_21152 [Hyphomicrobiales bacterium]CAH1684922.1 hypothetical protein CHELA20_53774 [Hyphomicrobiales bacterium]